jgi:hypothetical protein
VSIVWVVLGIIGVLIFLDGALGSAQQRTGLSVNGHQLTREEAREGFQEVAQIAHGVKAGDPHSIDSSFQPQTELGQRFKDLMLEAQRINDDYMRSIAGVRSPGYLTPKELSSADGRNEARRIHKSYVAATLKYEGDTTNYLQHFTAFIGEMTGKEPAQLHAVQAENGEMAQLEMDESKSIDAMLDFVDQAQPRYDAKTNKLIFVTKADVAKYRSLADDIFAKQNALFSRKQQILAHRQQAINRDMADLQTQLQS